MQSVLEIYLVELVKQTNTSLAEILGQYSNTCVIISHVSSSFSIGATVCDSICENLGARQLGDVPPPGNRRD